MRFIQLVEYLNNALHIPATLKEFGVSEDKFMANLDVIAEGAVGDPCTSTNPRKISVEQMRELFIAAYYGT